MLSESKLILRVKEHKILYSNSTTKTNNADESKRKRIWDEIAQEFKLEDGNSAKIKWLELTQNYIKFLSHGDVNAYPHSNEMIFMQPYIMSLPDSPDHSDLDIDDSQLQRILCSDDECDSASLSTSPKDKCKVQVAEENHMDKRVTCVQTSHKEHTDKTQSNIEHFSNATSFSNMSSLELIFLGYAKVLQKMPLALQLQTKRKIAEVMDEAEMMMLEQ